jgi:hypothetical protein
MINSNEFEGSGRGLFQILIPVLRKPCDTTTTMIGHRAEILTREFQNKKHKYQTFNGDVQ